MGGGALLPCSGVWETAVLQMPEEGPYLPSLCVGGSDSGPPPVSIWKPLAWPEGCGCREPCARSRSPGRAWVSLRLMDFDTLFLEFKTDEK